MQYIYIYKYIYAVGRYAYVSPDSRGKKLNYQPMITGLECLNARLIKSWLGSAFFKCFLNAFFMISSIRSLFQSSQVLSLTTHAKNSCEYLHFPMRSNLYFYLLECSRGVFKDIFLLWIACCSFPVSPWGMTENPYRELCSDTRMI